jgi:hypothetical protein
MYDDALKRLDDIHTRLVEVRDWAKANGDFEMASTLVMVGGDLNNLFVKASLENTMNGDTFERLSAINDRLIQLCDWLHDKRDFETASRLIPITSDLAVLLSEIGATKGKRR